MTVTLPETKQRGLTAAQVSERVRAGQVNKVNDKSSRSIGQIIRANIFTLFNAIILAAMILVLLTGQWKDAVFGFVIIINTCIGIFTELRAKQTLDSLSILIAAHYFVRRDGQNVEVTHDGIVLGDLLWIRSGDQVPADAKILENYGIELDESMLTGESRTVKKRIDDTVYSGATVVSGMALVQVTAVGENSYAAKLTAEAKVFKRTHSDLNAGINTILKVMTFFVVPLCALLIWSQLQTVGGFSAALASGAWRSAVVSAVAGVVGMIPEGLVLLTSLNFAIAAMRLARQNTLVQEMEAVETLARVDVLNLDKTGTITDGGIALDGMILTEDIAVETSNQWENFPPKVVRALHDVCNETSPNTTALAVMVGLSEFYKETNLDENSAIKNLSEAISARTPFSSDRKWSAIAYSSGEQWFFGAPEVVLLARPQGWNQQDPIVARINRLAESGVRVLVLAQAFAQPDNNQAKSEMPVEQLNPELHPVALVICSESVRADAQETLAWFREQGVRPRVISGDNPRTVAAIAQKVQLVGEGKTPRFMDARELPKSVEEIAKVVENVDVIGRVLPEQKKAIVQALHLQNHTVAMTGDGVNDALALKEADLGIAMGNAAPATKAVAQIVLVDSLFSHLPSVVARGRQVMANMERVAGLFLVKTVYSLIISLGVVLSGISYPYLPRHITYVGALTIGIPAFILALTPNTRRYIPGFLQRVVQFAIPGGTAIGLTLLTVAWVMPKLMGWDTSTSAGLSSLRATSAVILFVLGIGVLCLVAQPLNSWRGVLVLIFACAGIIGMHIPFVASFFNLRTLSLPVIGASAAGLIIAVAIGLIIRAIIRAIVFNNGRIITQEINTR